MESEDVRAAALHAIDLALLQTASLFDWKSPESRKASNAALVQLFMRLHPILLPDVVFEIGAHDASASCLIRKRVPDARIFAFEANPNTYAKFKDAARLKELNVDYRNAAVTDNCGPVSFYVQKARDGKPMPAHAPSNSVLERLGDVEQVPVEVEGVALTDFIAERGLSGEFSAWIDVEGAVQKVFAGMRAVLARFRMIFCEVEEKVFWKEQWLWKDVLSFMVTNGFYPVARDFEYSAQHNVLFIRSDLLALDQVRRALVLHYSSLRPPDGRSPTAT